MDEKSNRIQFIDYFKALLMILVIAGHVNYANADIKAWIYSFHMPAFFFASGLLLNTHFRPNLKDLLRKYTDKLVFPYILWGLVFAQFTIPNLLKIIYGSYRSIANAGALTSLWFLPVMFIAILFFYLLLMVFKGRFTIWVKVVCSIVAFAIGFLLPKLTFGYAWSINVAFVALGFILLGSALKFVVFWFREYCKKKNFGWVLCTLFLVLFLVATMVYKYNIPEQGFVLMGNARYGNPLLFMCSSLFGVFAILLLGLFLELIVKEKDIKYLSFVGQNTLCFFALQKPIIKLFSYLFGYIQIPDVITLILTIIGVLLISSLFCVFINKHLPVFVGKQPLLYKKYAK